MAAGAIRSGKQDACADVMTGDRKARSKKKSTRRTSKNALQFAPNFTIYTMLPDVVCLYSEDRKFFLHGELYCALASAIGKGGKSLPELVGELGKNFPSDKVEEALKRLIDRRYIIPVSGAPAAVLEGYWASLGLPPGIAEQNLGNCRVRVEAIDVHGAAEFTAALSEFGVSVVKRNPDLTITLVNDYLERRLAELNQQRVSDQTPWLLVQPSGVFPLVGPFFNPGNGPCWTCLFDRMIRNREVKGFLDRAPGRAVAVSPLARNALGQGAIQFAALEVAKAIATGFRTELNDHIISHDLLGSNVVKHYVATRPQCPTCGNKKLRNPRRAPAPIELSAGAKLVMTSGGYRSVTSRATVERFRKHVSPLTGVVTRLERMESHLPMNTSFYAAHNFSAPAQNLNELRAGLTGGSFGKGSTAEQGEASALMEAIERYTGVYQGDEIRVLRRFSDFPPGDAMLPNEVLLYSDAQSESEHNPPLSDPNDIPLDPTRFDQSARLEWSPVWSLRDHRFRYLPTSTLYFFYRGPYPYAADSNGCAAGNTREEAIVQGFLELVERDAYAIWWYNRLRMPEVDLDRFDDAYISDLKSQLANAGRKLWVLDVTSDLGVPTYVAILHWMQDGKENIEFGSGAHFDPRIAMLRALTELNQFLSIGLMGGGSGEKSSLDGDTPLRLEDHPFLLPSGKPPVASDAGSKVALDNTRDQVLACVDIARRAGLDFLVLDQTRPDIETPVVRVIVPGLRHFYRRFAPGRLYDIPMKLGLRDQPLPENELTPFLPHT
jgi:bacteriocin biosynthesis cyclodehydratase domain-containing protein